MFRHQLARIGRNIYARWMVRNQFLSMDVKFLLEREPPSQMIIVMVFVAIGAP